MFPWNVGAYHILIFVFLPRIKIKQKSIAIFLLFAFILSESNESHTFNGAFNRPNVNQQGKKASKMCAENCLLFFPVCSSCYLFRTSTECMRVSSTCKRSINVNIHWINQERQQPTIYFTIINIVIRFTKKLCKNVSKLLFIQKMSCRLSGPYADWKEWMECF